MATKALVPGHFLEQLRPAADVLQVTLVPYDEQGKPQADSGGSEVFFRFWLSNEQGDRIILDHPSLKWLHAGATGIDQILTPAFLHSRITLTNSAGVHATSVAEWTIAGILALEKGLRRIFDQQRRRVWDSVEREEFSGKKAVILGAGRVATEVASRLRPFGVRLVCVRRRSAPQPLFDETHSVEDLWSVVGDADWLIITLPLTRETRGLVDERLLAALPPKCRLVNVARGEIVDEQALVDALAEKRIAGAVLDVFSQEPLPDVHPFWTMPEVIVLPHTTWRSPQVRRKQIELFLENLRRFVKGEPLLNVVDVRSGY